MTATVCAICARPTVDTAVVCWTCTNGLGDALDLLIKCADDFDVAITRQAKTSTLVGGRSSDTQLPFDDHVAEIAWVVTNTITGWADAIAEARGTTAPRQLEPAARFIRDRLATLRVLAGAEQGIAELQHACHLTESTLDTRPGFDYLGTCDTDTSDGPCGQSLRAIAGSQWMRCPACRTPYDVAERRAWIVRRVRHLRVPVPVIASIVSGWGGRRLPANTVYSWIRRGQLAQHGRDPRTGQPLYRLGDAIDRADRTRKDPTK